MVSSTTFSGLVCLVLSLGPATVLSAPQIPGVPFPELINHGPETTTDAAGNTETSAGSGVNVGIPGGPTVNVGAGFHDSHRPCGPNDHRAGAGVHVGIPGGPTVNVGTGKHSHEDAYPCEPETPVVVVVPTTTAINPPVTTANPPILPPTFVTPISIPTTTAPVWVPAVPVVPTSTPLIHPAPTATPSPSYAPVSPVFNAGAALAPGSLLAVAIPVIMAFFH
ncbi:uncharacterized protein N7515_000547 [Penicillium bovifimosum]|uniref:Uncharacterized protein n=1 Tax=Penicillium bovifimosum TaxID=126998 RepID=A0A9W9HFM9_9EURO|nr:uncharacterized protein N7515_000547 [Penicillium bovifimosum]KAJ5145983.1 hypothetical protein N7515_000547 [Penicillium bovifimosum]